MIISLLPSEIPVNTKARKKQAKVFINTYKSMMGCKYCGEIDWVCLDFHHVNPAEKTDTVANLAKGGGEFQENYGRNG